MIPSGAGTICVAMKEAQNSHKVIYYQTDHDVIEMIANKSSKIKLLRY